MSIQASLNSIFGSALASAYVADKSYGWSDRIKLKGQEKAAIAKNQNLNKESKRFTEIADELQTQPAASLSHIEANRRSALLFQKQLQEGNKQLSNIYEQLYSVTGKQEYLDQLNKGITREARDEYMIQKKGEDLKAVQDRMEQQKLDEAENQERKAQEKAEARYRKTMEYRQLQKDALRERVRMAGIVLPGDKEYEEAKTWALD